jgi:pilus assembly protein Flp/PilA
LDRTGGKSVCAPYVVVQVVSKMEASMNFVTRFVKDESGATAIEYGLIAASIAVVIITAVQTLGTKLTATFTSVAGAL